MREEFHAEINIILEAEDTTDACRELIRIFEGRIKFMAEHPAGKYATHKVSGPEGPDFEGMIDIHRCKGHTHPDNRKRTDAKLN